jgi:hypothetical protein
MIRLQPTPPPLLAAYFLLVTDKLAISHENAHTIMAEKNTIIAVKIKFRLQTTLNLQTVLMFG